MPVRHTPAGGFALPPTGCRVSVSEPSRECFRRVNSVGPACERSGRRRYHLGSRQRRETSVNGQPSDPGAPLSTLRGAGVAVDARRVGQVVVAVVLTTLVAVAAALFVAGADKNAQVTELRLHGVRVPVTVTSCIGLLGGSGSNAAGYACRGAYSYQGRRYAEAIPGDVERTPGSTLVAVIAPDDPGLLSTPAAVRDEHASWRVYLAPGILAVLAAALAALAGTRWRRARRAR